MAGALWNGVSSQLPGKPFRKELVGTVSPIPDLEGAPWRLDPTLRN